MCLVLMVELKPWLQVLSILFLLENVLMYQLLVSPVCCLIKMFTILSLSLYYLSCFSVLYAGRSDLLEVRYTQSQAFLCSTKAQVIKVVFFTCESTILVNI